MQEILPLIWSVPSSNENSTHRYVVEWDAGLRVWSCTCEFYRRTGKACRHILEKRLECKESSVFGGMTVEACFDEKRLLGQSKRVFGLMCDGVWRTLGEIQMVTGDPQASVSARLRDFRKARFGGHCVDRRRRGDESRGLWEYRLVVK